MFNLGTSVKNHIMSMLRVHVILGRVLKSVLPTETGTPTSVIASKRGYPGLEGISGVRENIRG